MRIILLKLVLVLFLSTLTSSAYLGNSNQNELRQLFLNTLRSEFVLRIQKYLQLLYFSMRPKHIFSRRNQREAISGKDIISKKNDKSQSKKRKRKKKRTSWWKKRKGTKKTWKKRSQKWRKHNNNRPKKRKQKPRPQYKSLGCPTVKNSTSSGSNITAECLSTALKYQLHVSSKIMNQRRAETRQVVNNCSN